MKEDYDWPARFAGMIRRVDGAVQVMVHQMRHRYQVRGPSYLDQRLNTALDGAINAVDEAKAVLAGMEKRQSYMPFSVRPRFPNQQDEYDQADVIDYHGRVFATCPSEHEANIVCAALNLTPPEPPHSPQDVFAQFFRSHLFTASNLFAQQQEATIALKVPYGWKVDTQNIQENRVMFHLTAKDYVEQSRLEDLSV